MQDNQKYFCLLDAEGKLLPRFITVANIESKDPQQIIAGNEKVVRPRLTDAEFFFKQDKKQKLEEFNQRLQNVVFQEKLGSVYDKAERVSKLARLHRCAHRRQRFVGRSQRELRRRNATWPPKWSASSRRCRLSPATTTPSMTASRKMSPWP